ncbi:LEPR-XLL domain-containing protein, partial [Mesorhizobium sp. M4A.F.Ca.ET.029.04.2.1]
MSCIAFKNFRMYVRTLSYIHKSAVICRGGKMNILSRPAFFDAFQKRFILASKEEAPVPGVFGRWLASSLLRRSPGRARRPSKTSDLPNLALEALEARYLLSADVVPFAVDMNDLAGADYSLRYDNLIQTIQIYDNKTDTLIDQRNAQQVDYIVVRGTAADDKLTIDFGENFLAALDVR